MPCYVGLVARHLLWRVSACSFAGRWGAVGDSGVGVSVYAGGPVGPWRADGGERRGLHAAREAVPMAMTSPTPAVSVVVIGRNEGARLLRCVESVRQMVPPPGGGLIELIYVDCASTDGSAERAAALGARVVRVRREQASMASARNAGWRTAMGPFVLFIHGNRILDPRFVAGSLPAFEDPRVAVVWGCRREKDPGRSLCDRVLDFNDFCATGLSEFCGGEALVRATVLEMVGGYDDTMSAGEQWETCRRILAQGYRILRVDRVMTVGDTGTGGWWRYWRRAVYAGYGWAEVAERRHDVGDRSWDRKLRRNRLHATALIGVPAVGTALSLAVGGWAPMAAAAFVLAAAVGHTAMMAGWNAADFRTRLLYGLHLNLQQVPLLVGQIEYYWNRGARGRRLVEQGQPVR